MAKIKDIKKDISYLTEQLLLDSLEVSEVADESNKQKVLDIIIEIASFHNELIGRVNHPDGKDNPKLIKAYYSKIITDLLEGSDKIYEKLNKLMPDN